MKKTTGFAVAGICLALAAHGSANVFDDAVFWFRGGKDINGDGCMQTGEFFDDLHANDTNNPNHKMSAVNYSLNSNTRAFKTNASFMPEQVVFPALGKSAEKSMQVLRLANKAVKSGDNYYYPEVLNPRSIFVNNSVSDEFTIISRMRLDDDGLARTQCVFKIGYNATAKQGMTLGFSELQRATKTKYITGRRTPSENGNDASFRSTDMQIPTNTWFDLAVVVGGGNLRIGIALPATSSAHGNNSTIVFADTKMWTANSLSTGDDYRLFCYKGQTTYQLKESADLTCFIGSVQQMAIWKRALGDEEVMAAFGMPRPAIFRTGFDNGVSNEFGGTRPNGANAAQTIDGLGSWQGIWDTMLAGDTWTVNFDALRDEHGLPQIFSLRSLPTSAPAKIEVRLNDTLLGTRYVNSDARVFWPVAADLVVSNANTLTVHRVDDGSDPFLMDAMELGGALGVGRAVHTIDDGRVYPERIATGVPSAADPNPAHWPVGFRPYLNNNTNLHFCVWVDPDVVGVCNYKFSTCANRYQRDGYTVEGSEFFTVYVNSCSVTNCMASNGWENVVVDFNPGTSVLRGGWNDFEIRSEDYDTCHWLFDRYRFETVLPKAFSIPPPGIMMLVR